MEKRIFFINYIYSDDHRVQIEMADGENLLLSHVYDSTKEADSQVEGFFKCLDYLGVEYEKIVQIIE